MANTFKDLDEGLKAFSRALRQETEDAMKGVSKRALEVAVRGTPVDTARSRSNWIVTTGASTRRQRPAPFRTLSRGGIGEGFNAQATIAAGNSVIDTYTLGNFTIFGSADIFIQNNTPYIEDLDRGSSKQAPAGFSDFAVQAALREANKFRVRKF